MHPAVAEALERLAEGAHAAHPLAPHLLEIDLDRHQLLGGAALVDHPARRVEHAGLAVAARIEAVDVEQVALEHGGTGLGHVQIDVAVDGVGHHRVEDHLRPHRRHGARRLREPEVVAIEHGELADVRHLEDAELVAGRHPLLERGEGEHLAVAGDHLAVGVDYRRGVVNPPVAALVQRARHQPQVELARHGTQGILGRPGQPLGALQAGAEHAQLAEHRHLHPRIEVHHDLQPVAHGLEIVAVMKVHLHPGDRERRHHLLLPGTAARS